MSFLAVFQQLSPNLTSINKLGGNRICSNKIFERYFELALIYKKSDEYIFRAIRKIKTAKKLRNKNRPLSHARTGELLLDALVG